jgi:hypothetical protein
MPSVFQPDPRARVAGTLEVPTVDFQQLPDHPSQRVTELHAGTLLVRGILEHALDVHRDVDAFVQLDRHSLTMEQAAAMPLQALLPLAYKGNGHTRSLLWREDRVPVPETVRLTVHLVADTDTSVRLYNSFDSSDSSKRTNDMVQSAMRLAGIEARGYLRTGRGMQVALGYCMEVLRGGKPPKTGRPRRVAPVVAELVPRTLEERLNELVPILPVMRRFKPAIDLLDQAEPRPKSVPLTPAYLGGYISILHRDADKGLDFIKELVSSAGDQLDEEMDAVFAVKFLDKHIAELRKQPGPARRARMQLACVLNAYTAYTDGRMLPSGAYPTGERIIASFNPELKPAPRRRRRAEAEATAETGLLA